VACLIRGWPRTAKLARVVSASQEDQERAGSRVNPPRIIRQRHGSFPARTRQLARAAGGKVSLWVPCTPPRVAP